MISRPVFGLLAVVMTSSLPTTESVTFCAVAVDRTRAAAAIRTKIAYKRAGPFEPEYKADNRPVCLVVGDRRLPIVAGVGALFARFGPSRGLSVEALEARTWIAS